MKILVFTAGFYDRDYDEKLERLMWTAKHFNIDIHVYGRGEFFSFFESKINGMGRFLDQFKNEYTHALYTDASDSFFLSDLATIIKKYQDMESPALLVSAERSLHPFPEMFSLFPEVPTPYRYMNPGNYIAEIPYLLDVISKLKSFNWLKTDDQGHWMAAYERFRFPLVIDWGCRIFQTMSDCNFPVEFEMIDGLLCNKITREYPSIVHFNGPKGDTDNGSLMNQVFTNLKNYYAADKRA